MHEINIQYTKVVSRLAFEILQLLHFTCIYNSWNITLLKDEFCSVTCQVINGKWNYRFDFNNSSAESLGGKYGVFEIHRVQI